MFDPGFTSPNLLKTSRQQRYRTITFFGSAFQPTHVGTPLIRFRSPLLTESRLLSFPPATEMFQFAGFAFLSYAFRQE